MRSENYPYSDEEVLHAIEGEVIIPQLFMELKLRVNQERKSTLIEISKCVKRMDVNKLLNLSEGDKVCGRFAMALKYYREDRDYQNKSGDCDPISRYFGESQILDYVSDRLISNDGSDSSVPAEIIGDQIIASLIALLIAGEVRKCLEMIELFERLATICSPGALAKKNSFLKSRQKSASISINKLKMLSVVCQYLNRNEIPTKKKVREDMNIDSPSLSKLMRGSCLCQMLPDSKWLPNQFREGEIYRVPSFEGILKDCPFPEAKPQ